MGSDTTNQQDDRLLASFLTLILRAVPRTFQSTKAISGFGRRANVVYHIRLPANWYAKNTGRGLCGMNRTRMVRGTWLVDR